MKLLPRRKRKPRQERARERAQREAGDGAGRVDDHHPPGPVQLGGRGRELPQRHHVEEDVQQAAVQPAGAEDRPPAAELEDRHGAARAEQEARFESSETGTKGRRACRCLPREASSVST